MTIRDAYRSARERYVVIGELDHLVRTALRRDRWPLGEACAMRQDYDVNLDHLGEVDARSAQMGLLERAVYRTLSLPFVMDVVDPVIERIKK